MKVSTKARYGLRAIMELGANYSKKRPLLLKEIAKRQEISLKYLDHIFALLKKIGIVKSAGKGKGYILSKAPSQIKVWEIIEVLEETTLLDCLTTPNLCKKAQFCAARSLWRNLANSLRRSLENISLEDLLREQEDILKRENKNAMYYI